MFLHHIKIAIRNLRKYKSQTIIGVLGLTTACVVFAICCYVASLILLKNTEFPNHERMYRIETLNYRSTIRGSMEKTLGEMSGVEKFTAIQFGKQYYGHLLMEGNESDRLVKLYLLEADANFWDFFSLQTVMGNPQTILNTPNSIVLYEKSAKKIGTIDALQGSSIIVNDVSYTITGILKTPPVTTDYLQGDGLIFNQENGYFQQIRETWNPRFEGALIMLTKGLSQNDFQTSLDAYPFVFVGDQNSDFKEQVHITSINKIAQELLFIMLVVLVVGLLVLFVALFNIISFQTAQIYNRLKECAIRKLTGAGRGQLLLSFYMEIFIVFALSYIFGIMTLDLLKPVSQYTDLAYMFQEDTVPDMKKHLIFSVLFGLVITFLFCLVSVQIISRQSVRVVFMGLTEKVSKQRGRKIMLFIQMLVMLLFLSSTLILRLQINNLKENIWHTLSTEEKKNIFIFSYNNEETSGQFDVILQQLKQSSAVEDVFFSSGWSYSFATTIDKHENQRVKECRVSHNFTEFFNAKLITGRFWNENDIPDAIVVDETLAAFFPDNNPVGINIDGKIIIGIVENIQMSNEQGGAKIKQPVCYSRVDKLDRQGDIYVKAIASRNSEVQQHITQIQKEFYPEFFQECIDFQTYIRRRTFVGEAMFSMFFGIFSTISLILCLLSIYSAITMNTEKRRKEVAIRKINGAETKDIILLFSKTYILLWSGVCLLSFPLIYYAGNILIESYSQRISLNLFFFSGIYFSILLLIFFMIIFRIIEVARANPSEVLKTE